MEVEVKLKPNAQKESVDLKEGMLFVSVKEKARRGKANLAMIKLLAREIGCVTSDIRILSGLKSRKKRLEMPEFDWNSKNR